MPQEAPARRESSSFPIVVSSLTAPPLDFLDNDNHHPAATVSQADHHHLPRLVTRHPFLSHADAENEASIEVRVEEAAPLGRYRVVIGPHSSTTTTTTTTLRHIHASFLLPEPSDFSATNKEEEEEEGSLPQPCRLAWTHFDTSKDHNGTLDDDDNKDDDSHNDNPPYDNSNNKNTFLCVLVHPNLVSIHNVYPNASSAEPQWTVQQEGWSVPLPLECCSIFAIPGGGLLLQRVPDPAEWDDVILELPPIPHPNKLQQQQQQQPNLQQETAHTSPSLSTSAVPSLFTLRHYQEDLTPLAHVPDHFNPLDSNNINNPNEGSFWNDPLEQVLWVGETWPSYGHHCPSQVLVVTYHVRLLRHSIWSLQEAPPPPPPPTLPMYYAARHNYHTTTTSADTNVDLSLAYRDPALLLDDDTDTSHDVSSDALAEALGVSKRTPRPSAPFWSPKEKSVHTYLDTTMAAADPMPQGNFFSTIHSHHVTHGLYQEHSKTSPQAATHVFAISNPRASGKSVLVWKVPDPPGPQLAMKRKRGEHHHSVVSPPLARNQPQRLCFFETTSEENESLKKNINNMAPSCRIQPMASDVACLDAQPIEATPFWTPPRVGGNGRDAAATDLLVLQTDHRLVLHRAQAPVTEFTLPGDEKVVALVDPVGSRVGLLTEEATRVNDTTREATVCHRVSIQLKLPCPLAEKALGAIQYSLEQNSDFEDAALLFRADCVRVYQSLLNSEDKHGVSTTGLPFQALSAVVLSIVEWDLMLKSQTATMASSRSAKRGGASAWERLQASDYGMDHDFFPTRTQSGSHLPEKEDWLRETYASGNPQFLHCVQRQEKRGKISPLLFDPLHLLLEDAALSNQANPSDLVSLLSQICRKVPSSDLQQAFLDHYRQYFSSDATTSVDDLSMEEEPSSSAGHLFTSFQEPPSILHWIEDVFCKRKSSSAFESISKDQINPQCCHIYFAKRAIPLLCKADDKFHFVLVELLVEEGLRDQLAISETFVPALAFPLLTLLNRLTNEASERTLESSSFSSKAFSLIGRKDLSLNMRADRNKAETLPPIPAPVTLVEKQTEENTTTEGSFTDVNKDGLVPLEVSSSMLFPDNRIHEAARLVRSSRPLFLRVPRLVEITDHEYEQLKQRKLSLLVRRALALPVGRGMITIGSLKPLAAESLPLPDLCLKGRTPTNTTLSLDETEYPPEEILWSEFHNGCAAGLRLPLYDDSSEMGSQITRTWILYNKPPRVDTNNTEANTNNPNSVSNTAKVHAHGGFLLALGLRGHLTALEMTDIYEYLTQGTITLTVGVLLGMAANRKGSCDMSISKMLCLHIPSLIPQHFSAIDVASAVQAAAVTGVGLLYQKSSHRMMTEFLLNEIGKRPESDTSAFDRESYTLSCGIALGMVNLCIGKRSGDVDRAAGISDLRVEERLRRYINGGQANEEEARRIRESNDRFSISSTTNGAENERTSIIFESNMINTDVTAPAATLALGLMYMKSGNRTVASAVSIPQTHFLLEFVRPDFLGLRVIAKSLILWNEVEPTTDWIERQVPQVIQSAYISMRSMAARAMEGRTPVKGQRIADYDKRAVRQIYVNVIAGACFSVGLRYAGTGDERAKKALFDYVILMHRLREGNDPVSVVSKPEFPILETCLGLCAISLGMVMAGTGDLDALRLFKTLRWRHDKDIVYGTHMVIGSAIGLLFLGGGTMTLGRSPEDIAALIAAFFPRFPTESLDNQYHLQALRHLYSLAAKKADVWAIDMDSNERCYVPVETLAQAGGRPYKMQVPCLLRNSDVPVQSIKVLSGDFYPMIIRIHAGTNVFYVKRRRAQEATIENPTPLCIGKDVTHQLLRNLEYLSLNPVDEPFIQKLVSDQQSKDKQGVFLLFLSLLTSLRTMNTNTNTSSAPFSLMWNLRLMRSFYESDTTFSADKGRFPLEAELLALLLEKAYYQVSKTMADDPRRNLLSSILFSTKN